MALDGWMSDIWDAMKQHVYLTSSYLCMAVENGNQVVNFG
jgi:hypothetical protein